MNNDTEIETFRVKVEKATEIKDGVYPITLEKVTLQTGNKFGDTLVWYVSVKTDAGTIRMSALSGASLTVSATGTSKAYAWVKAILGKVPVIGEDFSFEVLKGKEAKGIIKNETKDGRTYAKLKDILPK